MGVLQDLRKPEIVIPWLDLILSNLMVSNFGIGMGSSIENEIHVLQSRTFTGELAQRIYDERYQPDGRLLPGYLA